MANRTVAWSAVGLLAGAVLSILPGSSSVAADDGVTFHPSYCGHVAMAQQVERTIRATRGEAVPDFDDSCRGFGVPNEPDGPTVEERKAALRRALDDASLKAGCNAAGKVTARVKGGHGLIEHVEFRLRDRRVGGDRTSPYTLIKKTKRLARYPGRLKAAVRVRDAELRMQRVLKVKRPRCL